jgi:hypothetical protein
MRLTAARAIGIGLLYVVVCVAVSIVVALRHLQGEAHGPDGYINTISISTWWVALLVGPPLLLVAFYVWQRLAGGRSP